MKWRPAWRDFAHAVKRRGRTAWAKAREKPRKLHGASCAFAHPTVAAIVEISAARNYSSHLDDNLPVLHRGRAGFHRDHARRHHHLAGADVELAIVEVALDHVALDVTLGQRARPMGALVIKDIELALDVKDRHRQSVFLNLEGGAGSDVIGIAEFDLRRHGSS